MLANLFARTHSGKEAIGDWGGFRAPGQDEINQRLNCVRCSSIARRDRTELNEQNEQSYARGHRWADSQAGRICFVRTLARVEIDFTLIARTDTFSFSFFLFLFCALRARRAKPRTRSFTRRRVFLFTLLSCFSVISRFGHAYLLHRFVFCRISSDRSCARLSIYFLNSLQGKKWLPSSLTFAKQNRRILNL